MKKVILKAKVSDLEGVQAKLEQLTGEFLMPIWVHDRVFVPRNYESRKNWPRLMMRTEMRAVDLPPRYVLVLKRHIEGTDVDFINETTVINYEEMAKIIMQLGFTQRKEIAKQRQEMDWDDVVVRIDQVEGNYYIKLETELREGESAGALQKVLMERMKKLGVKEEEIVDEPYFEILS